MALTRPRDEKDKGMKNKCGAVGERFWGKPGNFKFGGNL